MNTHVRGRSTTCDHDEPLKSEARSSEVGLMTTCRIVASGQCRRTPSSACDIAVDVEPNHSGGRCLSDRLTARLSLKREAMSGDTAQLARTASLRCVAEWRSASAQCIGAGVEPASGARAR